MEKNTKALILVAVMTLFCLLLASCGKQMPGEQEGKGKEVILKTATYVTPTYKDYFYIYKGFVDYVNEKGKGKIKIDFHHSGTLLTADQLLPGLMQGTADIIIPTDSNIMNTLPVFGICQLPFAFKGMDDFHEKTKMGTPVFELINQELSKKNLYMIGYVIASENYLWTKKPVRKPEDAKGLRIRGSGSIDAQAIEKIGAASVHISSAELYEALQRGIIDGLITYEGTISARNLQQLVKYCTKEPFSFFGAPILICLDKWQKLPKDVREILTEAGKEYGNSYLYAVKVLEEEHRPAIKKAGVQIIELTSEEEKRFIEITLPVWDWWKKQVPQEVAEKGMKLIE